MATKGAGLTSGREQNEMQPVGRRRIVVVAVGGVYCHQFSSREEQRHHGKDKVVGRGRVVKQGEEGSRKVPVMRTAACPKIGDDNRSVHKH